MKGIFHHEGVTYKAVFFSLPLYIINVGAYLIFLKKVWCENKKNLVTLTIYQCIIIGLLGLVIYIHGGFEMALV